MQEETLGTPTRPPSPLPHRAEPAKCSASLETQTFPRAPSFREHRAAQDAEAKYYENIISQVLST